MKNLFKYLQMVGQSLMLPVSVLPAAGLLLRFGEKDLLNIMAVKQAGLAIFDNLPLIFAVGVAIGFSGGAAVAALAAVVGQLILLAVLKAIDPNINMGVFAGIIIGITAAVLYKRYHDIKLPSFLGFFAGKRFVPIITSVAAVVIAAIASLIWPPIQNVINTVGHMAVSSTFGPALYAAGKRLLIPVGLHHIWYSPFLYEFGRFTTATGQVVKGDFYRYFAGDPTAGIFMASEFPILMFGLPAAALAIYKNAKPERKKAIGGLMASAGFTAFLTGITEPIEFAFIFVAPVLFIFHVLMAGISGIATHMLGIHLGAAFSPSFIDYLLSYRYGHNQLLLWPVGLAMALLYYFVFNAAIQKWDLKTPGREEGTVTEDGQTGDGQTEDRQRDTSPLAEKVLNALGGSENIDVLDACITRLRVTVKDTSLVKKDRFKELGAAGVMEVGKSLQIIFGTQSDALKEQIRSLMNGHKIPNDKREHSTGTETETAPTSEPIGPEKKGQVRRTLVKAPVSGKVMKLEDVPDAVFSQKLMGDGVAIEPEDGTIVAPVGGRVIQLFPTRHALTIKTEEGHEILVHVGLNTVNMKGNGFVALVKEGDVVQAGDKLLQVDLDKIREAEYSTITPVIIINQEHVESVVGQHVTAGKDAVIELGGEC